MDIILSIFAFIFGSVFASFFGVVCCRVPIGESISNPPSHCVCGRSLKWYENIPILSYIFLKGKCKECGSKIGLSSLMFEIVGGISLLFAYIEFRISFETLFIMFIVLIMLLMAMYDFYTNTIIDLFWIIFLVLAIGYYLYKVLYLKEDYKIGLITSLISGGSFLLIKLLFYFILKQDALGTGDVIVMAIAGLILSYGSLLVAILVGSLTGTIIELILIATKVKDREKPIPFLPYLCFGIYIALLYGDNIISLYERLLDAILFM